MSTAKRGFDGEYIVDRMVAHGWIDIGNGPESYDEWQAILVLVEHGRAFFPQPSNVPLGKSPSGPIITINGKVE